MTFYKSWLFACMICVLCMVSIGGFTRLKNAGLSITEWKPITGVMPPIGKSAWQKEMQKYSTTPEFQHINRNITLSEFKTIYLIEYFHRLFGRIIGLVFVLPFFYFAVTKKLKKRSVIILSIISFIGIVQGFFGWYMVKSGLVLAPYVSHYRLAVHLVFAALIFLLLGCEFFFASGAILSRKPERFIGFVLLFLIFLQIIFGAFVAGLKAGLVYNTFPLMNGQLIPEEIFAIKNFWSDAWQNHAFVQMIHRYFGIFIMVITLVLFIISLIQKSKMQTRLFITFALLLLQTFLGGITIAYHVPIDIALVHQVFAFVVLLLVTKLFIFQRNVNQHQPSQQ
jgi:cytochrome c oxidase assembly protein subunit 15